MIDLTSDDARSAVADRLARLFAEFGDRPAIQYQGRWYDWSSVARIDAELEVCLADVASDAPVAVVLRSRPWCLAPLLALLGRGRGVVLMSPVRGDIALGEDLAAVAPAVVVADAEDWARPGFGVACEALGIVGVEVRDGVGPTRRPGPVERPDATAASPVPADVAVVALSSGTTGGAKRMGVTWADFVPTPLAPRDPGTRPGAAILVLPLFSIGGIRSVADTIFGGRPISLLDRFDVEAWAALVEEHGPRRAGAPPAVLRMVLDAGIPRERFRTVTSIYTASAPLSPALAAEFEARYGIPIVQGYGATEFLGGVSGWADGLFERFGADKHGSVGRPLPGIRLRVVDEETGAEVAVGIVGTLEVDSPNRVKDLPPGWVRTSDLARIDEDGFLWIVGRRDDVVIRGGFKVDLAEVELTLEGHPAVAQACAVGLPDDRLGTVPHAVVVLRPDQDRDLAGGDLVAWARERLSGYAVPASVLVVDELPLNAMMKKDRNGARDLVLASVAEPERS